MEPKLRTSRTLLSAAFSFLEWLRPGGIRRLVSPKLETPRARTHLFVLPLTVIVYSMLVSTLFEAGHQRYRTPTDLLIFFVTVLGVGFLTDIRSSLKERRNGP